MTNNKAVEVANMMVEEFKIIGAAHDRLAKQMENLLAIVLETPAPAVKDVKEGKNSVPKKEVVAEKQVPADVVVEEEVDTDVDGEEEGLTMDDLQEMSLKELKELATENEVEFSKTIKKPALLKILEEAFFSEEEETVQEDVPADEVEETEEVSTVIETEEGDVDLAEMNVKQLKKFASEYELEITATKKDGIIAEILEQIYADDDSEGAVEETDPEDDGEDVAEQLGLNDMEVEELAEILEENGLSTKGKKQALIDRIVRAIEDGDIEIEGE